MVRRSARRPVPAATCATASLPASPRPRILVTGCWATSDKTEAAEPDRCRRRPWPPRQPGRRTRPPPYGLVDRRWERVSDPPPVIRDLQTWPCPRHPLPPPAHPPPIRPPTRLPQDPGRLRCPLHLLHHPQAPPDPLEQARSTRSSTKPSAWSPPATSNSSSPASSSAPTASPPPSTAANPSPYGHAPRPAHRRPLHPSPRPPPPPPLQPRTRRPHRRPARRPPPPPPGRPPFPSPPAERLRSSPPPHEPPVLPRRLPAA